MNEDANRSLVIGCSGTGKSWDVKIALKKWQRAIVFDPEDEYETLPGFVKSTSIQGVLDILQKKWKSNFKIAFVPQPGQEEKQLHELSLLIVHAQEPYKKGLLKKKLLLVVEEIDLSFPNQKLKKEHWGFSHICSRGRKRGIEVMAVAQRLAEVNTRLRGNATGGMKFFMPADDVDLQTMCKFVGRKNSEKLQSLQIGEFCHFKAGKVTWGKNK